MTRHRVGACAVAVLMASSAFAQRCPCPPFDLQGIVKKADVIFVGTALSATTDSTAPMRNNDATGWSGGEALLTRLLFDVERTITGTLPRFVSVVTPAVACGFQFAVGKRYLVTGTMQAGVVATDSCRGNVTGADAIDDRIKSIRRVLDPTP